MKKFIRNLFTINNEVKTEFKPDFKPNVNNDFRPNVNNNFRPGFTPNISVYVRDREDKKFEKTSEFRVELDGKETEEESYTLEDYIVKEEPYYEPQDGEKELFTQAFEKKFPFLLKGPTGSGKTRFVEHMAYKLNLPLLTVSCNEDTSATDLSGRHLLNERGTYWVDGPLTKAARHGGICYLDEVVEARKDAMVLIHSLTDHRRILPLDRNNETIKAHPDFMLVSSFNPHYQSVLKKMKESTRQRFVAFDMGYAEPEVESKIVSQESGLNLKKATKLVDFGNKTRELRSEGLVEGASTRLLIYAGKMLNSGKVNEYDVISSAIASPLTDDPKMYKKIMDLYN